MCDLFFPAEDGATGGGALDGLTWLQQAKVWMLPAWNNVHILCKGLEKMFWNYMVVAYGRKLTRRKAIKSAIKNKALKGFDAFLSFFMN